MKKASAIIAKERLQTLIANEQINCNTNQINLTPLKNELLTVITKYFLINEEQSNIELEQNSDNTTLKLTVTLPK